MLTTQRNIAFYGVLGIFLACVVTMALNGQFDVRPSADSVQTRPLWEVWVPPMCGIAAVAFCAPRHPVALPSLTHNERRRAATESVALSMLAIGFAVTVVIFGARDPATYSLTKVVLLLLIPALILAVSRRNSGPLPLWGQPVSGWWAVAPVAVWATVSFATPLAPSPADLIEFDAGTVLVLLVGGFAVNAVVEELFYRRWLQSRLEPLLGISAAVGCTTVVWSVWHAGIQSIGRLDVNLAAAVVNHAPMGVFLGLLWVRYRRMWPLLTVHGLLNAVPMLFGLG